MVALFYTKNGEDSLFFCKFFKSVDKLSGFAGRNAETQVQIALDRNPVKGKIILHSDHGSQYTSRAFTEFCEGKRIQQSMSKAGCPYDNSPMESFYGTFKSEFIQQNRFETDQELNESTLDYVYGYYNHIRPHSSNGYMTPFEKRYSNQ